MSAEAPKQTGITTPVPPKEAQGCLAGFLRRFIKISQPTQQSIAQTLQSASSEESATSLDRETSNPSVEPLDFSAEIRKIIIGLPDREPAKEIALSSVSANAEPTFPTRQSLTYEEKRVRFLAVNSYAENIAEVSGIRELFRQTYAIVEQQHLKTILAEGFDTWLESDLFHLLAPSASYMYPSDHEKQVYRIVLSWPMEGHEKYGRYFETGDVFKNRMHDGEELSYFYIGAECLTWGESWKNDTFDSGGGIIRIYTQYPDPSLEFTEKEWRDREIIKKAIIRAVESPLEGEGIRPPRSWSLGKYSPDSRDIQVAT